MPGYLTYLPDILSRANACLWGLAIGDALGATVEFMTPKEIRAQYGKHCRMVGGGWLELRPGEVTDDTAMSLCIARSLVAGGFNPEDMARRFADWLRSKPKDVGNTCRRGITRFIHHGSVHGLYNEGDAGNGAAMRMAPIALASLANVALLENMAVGQGHITHHHPFSDQASVLVGKLIQLALLGHSMERLRHQADATIAIVPKFQFAPFSGLSTAYVVDTIQTVLHFLFSTSSFEDCVVATVNQGGDADTTGAIVGAIAGAYYGIDAIPKDWLKKLDETVRDELQDLSGRLIAISPLGKGEAVTLFPPTETQQG